MREVLARMVLRVRQHQGGAGRDDVVAIDGLPRVLRPFVELRRPVVDGRDADVFSPQDVDEGHAEAEIIRHPARDHLQTCSRLQHGGLVEARDGQGRKLQRTTQFLLGAGCVLRNDGLRHRTLRDGRPHRTDQSRERERLEQECERSASECLGSETGKARVCDDGRRGRLGRQAGEELQPVHLGHHHVEQDDVGVKGVRHLQAALPIAGTSDLEALVGESLRERLLDVHAIVDD